MLTNEDIDIVDEIVLVKSNPRRSVLYRSSPRVVVVRAKCLGSRSCCSDVVKGQEAQEETEGML